MPCLGDFGRFHTWRPAGLLLAAAMVGVARPICVTRALTSVIVGFMRWRCGTAGARLRGVRVPTSVLLAVLAAAGLLALAPALVRRYDATERLVAERAISTARVLSRRRRRRTVPGRRPVRPPRAVCAAPVSAPPAQQTARPGRRPGEDALPGPARTSLRLVGHGERARPRARRR